ncbi:MAG: hypothetical protein LBE59_07220 [Nevskiaceae bacterium]|jgi:hypothetical protein|nr:hypothetical protein [Nevskiaceae bacterium]
MNAAIKFIIGSVIAMSSIIASSAEQAATPQPRATSSATLEPAVNTSRTEPAPVTATSAVPATPAAPTSATPPAPATSAAPAAPPATTTAAASTARAQDRLELDATQITGNRELPRVMYVVPWKRADLGDLTGRPVNSLLDEVLAPVDRDVFQRQNQYYEALRPGVSK